MAGYTAQKPVIMNGFSTYTLTLKYINPTDLKFEKS